MRDKGLNCFNYLDDIICLSKDYSSGVANQLEIIETLRFFGFYIAWSKICSPTRICMYLGIVINTETMCLSPPNDRLSKLREELLFWRNRTKATEKQLQRLLGHLTHCAHIIQGANLYMHFIFELLAEARTKRKVKLKRDFHDDLSWWYNLAFSFNSVIQFFDTHIDWPCVTIACQLGDWCGVLNVSDDNYVTVGKGEEDGLFNLFLPDDLVNEPTYCEVSAIWAYLFCHNYFNNCTIDIYCVKKQTFLSLKKNRTKNVLIAMLLRHIFWWSMERNYKLIFHHVPLN